MSHMVHAKIGDTKPDLRKYHYLPENNTEQLIIEVEYW